MNIKEIQTKSGKTLPLLFGDDGKVISEVYKYMRYCTALQAGCPEQSP